MPQNLWTPDERPSHKQVRAKVYPLKPKKFRKLNIIQNNLNSLRFVILAVFPIKSILLARWSRHLIPIKIDSVSVLPVETGINSLTFWY